MQTLVESRARGTSPQSVQVLWRVCVRPVHSRVLLPPTDDSFATADCTVFDLFTAGFLCHQLALLHTKARLYVYSICSWQDSSPTPSIRPHCEYSMSLQDTLRESRLHDSARRFVNPALFSPENGSIGHSSCKHRGANAGRSSCGVQRPQPVQTGRALMPLLRLDQVLSQPIPISRS